MNVPNPSLTTPLDTAVNEVVANIGQVLPYALVMVGILIGIGVAVVLIRRIVRARENAMMTAFYAERDQAKFEDDSW